MLKTLKTRKIIKELYNWRERLSLFIVLISIKKCQNEIIGKVISISKPN